MRLLRMVLRGFKSFAQATEIEFVDGVTGIVGPNGAGKSNIADAVRWVLGEQSIRQLRGEKAADVIFAGTEDVRPKGAAEVTLVFDNPNELLLLDVAEVAVTRRLLRSGDSEYLINRRPCRLKDIHLLFADTGLGKDSMAVIGQNRVDRILIGKPEDRKAIFEEVAGITRYRMRKQDGLRKLRAAEQNMQRVRDVVQVYAEQLEPLAQRARTARKYHEWKRCHYAAATTLAWQRWQNAQRKLTRAENEAIKAEQVLTAAQTAVVQAQAERERRLAADAAEAQRQRALEQERTATQTREERAKGEWRAVETQIEQHAARRTEAEQALAEVREELAQSKAELAAAAEREDECGRAYREVHDEMQAAVRAAEEAENAMRDYRERRSAREAARRAAQEETARQQARAAAVAKEVELLTERIRRQKQELTAYDTRVQTLQAEASTAVTAAETAQRRLTSARRALQTAQAEYAACERLRAERQEEAMKRQREIERRQERADYLARLAREYEGFGRATKTVLQAHESWRRDCIGTVADVMTVPVAYTTAMDIALGARLQHVVVRDGQTAKEAVRYLQRRGGGRTTFYPLTDIRARTLNARETAALEEDGVIGSAAQCVTCDAAYAPLVGYLLGGTLIVDTMETAQALVKKYERRLRMVTLDGQLFQPGGSVTGGSTRQAETTVFGRRQEQQRLQDELQALAQAPAVEIPTLDGVSAARTAAEEALRRLTAEALQADARREGTAAETARIEDTIRTLRAECDENRERVAALTERTAVTVHAQTDDAGDDTEAAPYTDDELAELRQRATRWQVRTAQAQGEIDRTRETRHNLNTKQQELLAQEQRQSAAVTAAAAESERLARRGETCRQELAAAAQAAADAARAAEAYYAAHGERREAEQAANAAYDKLREAERDAQSAAEVARAKVTAAREKTQERAQAFTATGCTAETIEDIRVDGTTPEIERQVAQAERAIASLGDVNPQAEEEYRQAQEQHQFYETQLEDLSRARHGLQDVINTIDREMEKQFTEAFATVGAEFQRIFMHLFGGGEARLELVPSEDDSVGGVEIFIRPPGKKRQSLSLLSGGERALTVIALLFAFQAVRPAPFCLVDEVDAALDDANVERFGRYLQSGRNETQFIVITHRKQTMQAADRLLGVTMAQKGISTVISVDLNAKEEHDELFR